MKIIVSHTLRDSVTYDQNSSQTRMRTNTSALFLLRMKQIFIRSFQSLCFGNFSVFLDDSSRQNIYCISSNQVQSQHVNKNILPRKLVWRGILFKRRSNSASCFLVCSEGGVSTTSCLSSRTCVYTQARG